VQENGSKGKVQKTGKERKNEENDEKVQKDG